MSSPEAVSHDVRVWNVSRYRGQRRTTYTVRWVVAGIKHQRTFATSKLADNFRAELMVAARGGTPFALATGLPRALSSRQPPPWLTVAQDYATVKWPDASARHRKGIAEALTDITILLLEDGAESPLSESQLRQALMRGAFRPAKQHADHDADVSQALEWAHRVSPPVDLVADPAVVRRVLGGLGRTRAGAPAAPSTVARKRATLNNFLEYAVERGLLENNPLARIRWKRAATTSSVDRTVVVNPEQARELLAATWRLTPSLAAFFGCLYYAGLRPSEARNLRSADCLLPAHGWGELRLSSSHQTVGAAWTDSGLTGEERGLKHRNLKDKRAVPAHPDLVRMLVRHLDTYQLGPDGRLFVSRTGKAGVPLAPPFVNPVAMSSVYRAWHQAREAALTPAQVASPLARRPYDLRHACLSTWLNAGVPPAQVAAWAGHSTEVLLRVYAKCVDGEEEVARQRIEAAVRPLSNNDPAGRGEAGTSARIPRDLP